MGSSTFIRSQSYIVIWNQKTFLFLMVTSESQTLVQPVSLPQLEFMTHSLWVIDYDSCITWWVLYLVRLAPNESLKELEGSPINCAPEMIKATGYNYPRDWWSVGIIIYHMIGTFYTPAGGPGNHDSHFWLSVFKINFSWWCSLLWKWSNGSFYKNLDKAAWLPRICW